MSGGVDDDDNNEQDALAVANNIDENGVGDTRLMIKNLTNEQRILAVKAVFYKLITGKKLS